MTDLSTPQTYKVTGAFNTEKEYGLNIGWKVDLVAADGTTYPDCFSLKKRGNGFKIDDEVYGHLEPGEYGMRFRGDALPGGGFQGGGQPLPTSAPENGAEGVSQPTVETDPEAARIARSVAVKGAVDLRCADAITDGQLLATAEMLTTFVLHGRRK